MEGTTVNSGFEPLLLSKQSIATSSVIYKFITLDTPTQLDPHSLDKPRLPNTTGSMSFHSHSRKIYSKWSVDLPLNFIPNFVR